MKSNYRITIAWLYPDLMSTYGDRGNVITLQKRCEWRNIRCEVKEITINSNAKDLRSADILFGGGAQDAEQEIVIEDLRGAKGKEVGAMIEKGVTGLFVCGSYQLLGKCYEPAEGKIIEGLGIFDVKTVHPGVNKNRLIGNTAVRMELEDIGREALVGFENHGGRTYLGKSARSFARVLTGFGNNGEDGTEGVVYKNAIGTYLHGPVLPKNPELADHMIKTALTEKYGNGIELESLNDDMERMARVFMLKRMGVETEKEYAIAT